MTGGLTHTNRPICERPSPTPDGAPCHMAMAILRVDGEEEVLCDFHAAELLLNELEPGDDVRGLRADSKLEEIAMIGEQGFVHRSENTTEGLAVWYSYRHFARAYVDYACCLPGGNDTHLLGVHSHE